MECLDNIIGISNATCECVLSGLSTEQKEEVRKSVSGLYLDGDLEGGVSLSEIKLLDNCEDYFNLAKKAILHAKKAFESDIQVAIGSKYKTSKARFVGELGRLQNTGPMAVQKPFQYMKIKPLTISPATMKIHNVRLNINTAKATNVKLIAVMDGLTYGDTIFEAVVNTVANRFTNVEIPINLQVPLVVNNRPMHYYFIWEREGNELPQDNGLSCGCSGGDAFDAYVQLSGGQSDDLETLGQVVDKYAHGFSVDAEISCETGGLVCSEFRNDDKIAIVSAWANLYKAGELLIEYVLQSPEINRFTLMNREYLWGKRNHFKKEYEMRIAYLGSEIDVTKSDCFVCRDTKMFIGNVFG